MKLKPLGDNLLVRPVEIEEARKEAKVGSIIIPDTAQKKPSFGEVMEVGPGKTTKDGKTIAVSVKKGDKVIYSEYTSRSTFNFNGEEYVILREDDVLVVIEK